MQLAGGGGSLVTSHAQSLTIPCPCATCIWLLHSAPTSTQDGFDPQQLARRCFSCHQTELSRNVFLGGRRWLGEVHPRQGSGVFPLRKMLVCLTSSTSLQQCILAGKNLLYAIILYCIEKDLGGGGSLSVWGRSIPPPPSQQIEPCQIAQRPYLHLLWNL